MTTRSRSTLGLTGGLVAGTVCVALMSETLYHVSTHGPMPRKEHLEVQVAVSTNTTTPYITYVSTSGG